MYATLSMECMHLFFCNHAGRLLYTPQVTGVPVGNLAIAKRGTPARRAKNGIFTFTLTLTPAAGSAAVQNVTLIDELPSGLTTPVLQGNPGNNCQIVKAGQKSSIRCTYARLTRRTVVSFTAKGVEIGTLTNVATVTYQGLTGSKQASATVTVWVSVLAEQSLTACCRAWSTISTCQRQQHTVLTTVYCDCHWGRLRRIVCTMHSMYGAACAAGSVFPSVLYAGCTMLHTHTVKKAGVPPHASLHPQATWSHPFQYPAWQTAHCCADLLSGQQTRVHHCQMLPSRHKVSY